MKLKDPTKMKVVFKITYPNGKIYIGKDLTDDFNYLGSVNNDLMNADFSRTDRKQRKSAIFKKDILFESMSETEVNKKEMELIKHYGSNNPEIGYNKHPKFKD
jgi:hypothetical protein